MDRRKSRTHEEEKSTRDYLDARGISVTVKDLGSMVREAIDTMHSTLAPNDAAAGLPPADLAILKKGGFDARTRALGKQDPLARTAAEYAAILETSLTTSDAAKRLGVDASRIRQRLGEAPPTIYGIRAQGAWRLPAFQFDGKRLVPSIGDVVARLRPDIHPVAVYRWFTRPCPDLVEESIRASALSPREWLIAGLSPNVPADIAELL